MPTRTHAQILDEIVYAVACAAEHYGPGLSEDGLADLRALFNKWGFWTDTSFRVDRCEDEPYIDFHERIIWPDGWDKLEFPAKDGPPPTA
jgi:hypothetical protein